LRVHTDDGAKEVPGDGILKIIAESFPVLLPPDVLTLVLGDEE
jgi:hypothetical protein